MAGKVTDKLGKAEKNQELFRKEFQKFWGFYLKILVDYTIFLRQPKNKEKNIEKMKKLRYNISVVLF